MHQAAIEDIFLDSMQKAGVTVDRNMFPTAIALSDDDAVLSDPSAYAVKVVLEHGEGEEEVVHAKFMVGTDGAHSWVRKYLGIAMEGDETEQIWGAIDFVPETEFADIRRLCFIQSKNGAGLIIPRENDSIRLYVQLLDKDVLDPQTGRVDRTRMTPEKLLETGNKILQPFKFTTKGFEWWTVYIIGQRVASQFSVNDRIFIAGDACHTHSPKAGQGMNASMSDTHNLAWKLALVIRGLANPSLLTTYALERRKFAQELIEFDRDYSKIFSGGPDHPPDSMALAKIIETMAGLTSGLGIRYADSTIVNSKQQSLAKNVIIGARMPPQVLVRVADLRPWNLQDVILSNAHFKILVFAGDITESSQLDKITSLAEELDKPENFFRKHSPASAKEAVFDIYTISSAKKEQIDYTAFPAVLRPHWSHVFVDDITLEETQGGKAYEAYGIESSGAIIVVRPDGYVGCLSALDSMDEVNAYFAKFMKSS